MDNHKFTAETLSDFETWHNLEWIETNGLGGYASSTVSGAHSRRYHGLLIASISPPVERNVVLSKLDEILVTRDGRFELSANQYPGVVHPQGYKYLQSFERNLFPVFTYQASGVKLKKTIAALQGENTTIILYEAEEATEKFTLELLPLCSFRDFHSLSHANDAMSKVYLFDNDVFQAKNYRDSAEFFIAVPNSTFTPSLLWYRNFQYSMEQYRGLDFEEDLFNHGTFTIEMQAGSRLGIIISLDNPNQRDAFVLFEAEQKRRQELIKHVSDANIQRLVLASDQFIVKRGENLKTVIAGYHWFSDWGRDTMISLTGLCLATKRFDEAKKIIEAFAGSVSEGMLPNRFPDHGEAPEYNTVDATLWFFHAIYKYYHYTHDLDFIKELLPVLQDIMAWHYKGTRYNIHVDADELLYAGQDGVQLTWMDAKVGDWVVTPRKGKAVEINALWYNALCIMVYFFNEVNDLVNSQHYKLKATKVKSAFNKLFWYDQGKYLYDFVDGENKNQDLRPNQLYALSLPFPLLSKDKAASVLDVVTKKLLTPKGLRSLSPDHSNYKHIYSGNTWLRDGCYHQGIVWSFLLGAYSDALIYVKGNKAKEEVKKILEIFFKHLDEAGVGTVSEIFDADEPYTPRGCIAQAWSVAEVLRVALEYKLFI